MISPDTKVGTNVFCPKCRAMIGVIKNIDVKTTHKKVTETVTIVDPYTQESFEPDNEGEHCLKCGALWWYKNYFYFTKGHLFTTTDDEIKHLDHYQKTIEFLDFINNEAGRTLASINDLIINSGNRNDPLTNTIYDSIHDFFTWHAKQLKIRKKEIESETT